MTGPALRFGLRSAWARRGQLLPYVVLLLVGVGIVTATTGIAGRAESAASDTAERDGAGRVVEVEVDLATGGGARLTEPTLARMRSLPGVREVLPAATVPIGVKTDAIPGVLFSGTTLQTRRPPIVRPDGGAVPTLRRGEVLLPASAQGSQLAGLVGRREAFESQQAVGPGQGTGLAYPLRTVALYDPAYQVDGRDVAYLATADVERLAAAGQGVSVQEFRRQVGFDAAQVVVEDEAQVPRVLDAVQGLGLAATTLSQQYEELPTVLALARLLGQVLGGLLLLVIVVAATVQTSLSVRTRWKEIGVLRAVGFGRRHVLLAFSVDAVLATLAGVVLGVVVALPLSLLLVELLGEQTATAARLDGATLPAAGPVLLFAVAVLLAGTAGALLAARRAAQLDPSTVLRSS